MPTTSYASADATGRSCQDHSFVADARRRTAAACREFVVRTYDLRTAAVDPPAQCCSNIRLLACRPDLDEDPPICKAVVFNTATFSQTEVALSGFLCTCQRPTPHHFSKRPAPTGLPVEGRQTISAPMPAVKDFLKKRSSRLPRPVYRRRIVTDSRHPSKRSHHRRWSYARQHIAAYAPSDALSRDRTIVSMVGDCD